MKNGFERKKKIVEMCLIVEVEKGKKKSVNEGWIGKFRKKLDKEKMGINKDEDEVWKIIEERNIVLKWMDLRGKKELKMVEERLGIMVNFIFIKMKEIV